MVCYVLRESIVDRIIGLYILFAFATATILITGFQHYPLASIRPICNGVFLVTGLGAAGIVAVLALDAPMGHLLKLLHRIPRVGPPVAQVLEDLRLYRHQIPTLLLASLLTVGVHSCSSISLYLISRGLPGDAPSLADHFVIVPLGVSTGVVPLPMGPMEAVLDYFYSSLPLNLAIAQGQGLLVALVNRLNAILLALAGVLCLLGKRGELAEAMHTAEPAA